MNKNQISEEVKKMIMSEVFKPSQNQIEAWNIEHDAFGLPELTRSAYHEAARALRMADTHEKLEAMDIRTMAQNEIIDIGLKMKGKKVPIIKAT